MTNLSEENSTPDNSTAYDSVAYQTVLASAYAYVKSALQRQQLDPLRYIVKIDPGLPVFAMRETHRLLIAYNHFETLSEEISIPHDSMVTQTGTQHDEFTRAVDVMVLALKEKVEAAGRPT